MRTEKESLQLLNCIQKLYIEVILSNSDEIVCVSFVDGADSVVQSADSSGICDDRFRKSQFSGGYCRYSRIKREGPDECRLYA